MTRNQTVKRYCFLGAGLLIMAYGVAFSIIAGLGTSPISSPPYVISCITPLTVGTATICMHCIMILLQILLLRQHFNPVQLMQLPVALLFGWLCDFALFTLKDISCQSYFMAWIFCLIGIFLVAVGVSIEVVAEVVTLAGEGTILALCKVTGIRFSTMKIIFDVVLVSIACILSFQFIDRLAGVSEGTVAAAFLVGLIDRHLNPWLRKKMKSFFTSEISEIS